VLPGLLPQDFVIRYEAKVTMPRPDRASQRQVRLSLLQQGGLRQGDRHGHKSLESPVELGGFYPMGAGGLEQTVLD